MNKKEFLNILRESLEGEVKHDIIEQNIRYYDQYISSQNNSENEVIERLGNPRLIARTIIETEKIAKEKQDGSTFHAHRSTSHDNYENFKENESHQKAYKDRATGNGGIFRMFQLRWYHKLIFALIMVLFILILFIIGKIIMTFIFAFAVPIIIVLLVFSLFRRRY